MGRDAGPDVRVTAATLATTTASEDAALRGLLTHLSGAGYAFVTPTPSTVSLVRDRCDARDEDILRDAFGWTRRFRAEQIDAALFRDLEQAGLVVGEGDCWRSTVRVSSVDANLFVHTAPTDAGDAVFLGPDTYRYARLLRHVLDGAQYGSALDLGTGAGVGALTLAAMKPGSRVLASDVNPKALRYTRLNAEAAGLNVETWLCDGIPPSPSSFDLIVANPPYIAGDGGRTYRDGGDQLGAALALGWLRAGLARLNRGGRFVLYTGSAIVSGQDFIRTESIRLADAHGCSLDYEEIDPDVFGSTLRQRAYATVDRIAAIGAVFTAPA